MNSIARALVAMALMTALGAVTAAPRSESMLANTCAGCHGTDGYSAGGNMPTLAGLNRRYLADTMNDYRTGVRPSTIMGRITRGYSETELQALAGYFDRQPWRLSSSTLDKKLVAKGEKLHQSLCASCHADSGRSQQRDTPRLAGQWRDYLYDQIVDMGGDHYHGSQPTKMLERVDKLTEADAAALSHFYASVK